MDSWETSVSYLENISSGYWNVNALYSRNSRPKVLCEKGTLKDFTKFTGKDQFQGLIFRNPGWVRPVTLREPGTGVFLWKLKKFLRTTFLIDSLRWLLLTEVLNWSYFVKLRNSLVQKCESSITKFESNL